MSILARTKEVKEKAKSFGRYRFVSEQSGVNYDWLTKFANDKIPNPGVDNVSKLEEFFNHYVEENAA